ncbi:hypothetical protein PB01_16700 [Psychrobacillus glaciei]|uniref:Uncharacterized protein n=1 Tax=Psychrobacillus glaciei TaxID=2283160 RepID=A0A5J6SQM0_9BACI|nr:hypothetical protein [Psychrobacillus glaciei]QFG00317.1 hypothetical protein PB01_16700 [Psychrobacillus glaciei]
MKRYIAFIMTFLLVIVPDNPKAEIEGYDIIAKLSKENITLYAKKMNDLYYDFKLGFKGEIYSRPFWISAANNNTYAPQIYYEDINQDKKKELIIILNQGYGTGVLQEEVHVYRYTNGLIDVLVDNPMAIINKNVKTKLTTEKDEIILGDKVSVVDPKSIEPSHLFEDIGFGSIIDYEVINKNLMVRVSGQITPATFVGDIIITYEYRDKMYQAKAIEFITDINKNPFYGPVKH